MEAEGQSQSKKSPKSTIGRNNTCLARAELPSTGMKFGGRRETRETWVRLGEKEYTYKGLTPVTGKRRVGTKIKKTPWGGQEATQQDRGP